MEDGWFFYTFAHKMEKEKKSEIYITNNFNAPIGQHIDHVDNINLHMDARGGIHVAGDFVVNKNVEYEVNNVENGGIGIQIVNNPQRQEMEVKPPEIHNHFESGSNCQVFNGPVSGCVFPMPGSNVTQMAGKTEERGKEESLTLTTELLGEAMAKVMAYVWGNAAYAVVFCVCRDVYGWQDNASYFERQLAEIGKEIPAGTINAALSRNPYMRLSVDKWKGYGVMERVLILKDKFCEQADALMAKV